MFQGYIKRQAIYACLTCCTEAKYDPTKRAGVCLACSLNCHENHELVELYTKRNFCCDCGNSKFNSHPCQFTPNKTELNEENDYNQNFSGLYCTCHRPYPDPESTIDDDEMIQCIICEDWLHTSHLDAAVPAIDQYSEMVCKSCMEKNEFLHDYSHLAVNIEIHDVDVVGINGTETKLINCNLNTELINGIDDSSKDATEKQSNDMQVDKAIIEDKPSTENDKNMENLITHVPVKGSNANESDITMEADNTAEPSQNLTDTKSKNESNTDTTEKTLESSEDTLEENTVVMENKENAIVTDNQLDENATATEANVTSEEKTTNVTLETADTVLEPQERNNVLENVVESKDNSKSEDTKKQEHEVELQSGTPTEDADMSKSEDETVEKTSENEKVEALQVVPNDSDAKPEEITSVTPADGVEPKTNKPGNDINDSGKESPDTGNTDLPQEGVINKADGIETDKCSTELVSEPEINKEETNETQVNTDEPSKAIIEESNETESKTEDSKEMKRKLPTEEIVDADDHSVKKPKLNEETCIRPKGVKRVHKGATFWLSNLRQKLCTCSECLSMYKDLTVLFLIDPEDTVFAYETLGKERVDGRATQYEKGLAALSSLDRIQQINALTEYNKMKDKLLDFLKSFKDRQEVVKEEDIKAFFAGMKPKREPDGVYFCR